MVSMMTGRQKSWRLLCLVNLQCCHASSMWIALLLLSLVKLRAAGSMWVEGVKPAGMLPSCLRGKVSSGASPSSVGLGEDASVALSVATKLALVVGLSDAFVVAALVIGRGSVVLALRLLVIALWLLVLSLWSLALLDGKSVV